MTWWQMLLVFWIYGTGARVDQELSKDAAFGFWLRLLVNLPFTAGAFVLTGVWVGGITW